MEKVYVTSRYQLKPEGNLEQFKSLITECIHRVARSCPNTLEYYWYIDEKENEFILRAKFEDSSALEHQLELQRKTVLEMLKHATAEIELFGKIDELTLHQFSLLQAKSFKFYSGISKDNGKIGNKVIA